MRFCFKTVASLVSMSTVTLAKPVPCSIVPFRSRCEHRVDPEGIDSPHPRLGWILQPANPGARGLAQSADEVLAASSPDFLALGQ